jgi:hypothetical protein
LNTDASPCFLRDPLFISWYSQINSDLDRSRGLIKGIYGLEDRLQTLFSPCRWIRPRIYIIEGMNLPIGMGSRFSRFFVMSSQNDVQFIVITFSLPWKLQQYVYFRMKVSWLLDRHLQT